MQNAGSIAMPLHFGRVPLFPMNRMGGMGEASSRSLKDPGSSGLNATEATQGSGRRTQGAPGVREAKVLAR